MSDGVGLNVNMPEKDLKFTLGDFATSLFMLTGVQWNVDKVIYELVEKFYADFQLFLKGGFAVFHEKYNGLLAYKNLFISFYDGHKTLKGTCKHVDMSGNLVVLLDNGEEKGFCSGEIRDFKTHGVQ